MWNTLIIDPMVNTLLWIYDLLWNNFGLAIIVFTVLIRLITLPLTYQQTKSAQKMQELQKSKEWQDIQKKHKGDREKLSQEQMRIYKEKGISPFGSCLPTVIQFPIIIGLYQAIIASLAVTPTQLFNLSTHIYPFIPAAALIPLDNTFLWIESLPARAVDYRWYRHSSTGNLCRYYDVYPIEVDDTSLSARRAGSPDDASHEPVYALSHGLAGVFIRRRAGIIFHRR